MIQIPLPDARSRQKMLMNFLGTRTLDFDLEKGCSELAAMASLASGRALRSWVERAEQATLARAYQNDSTDRIVVTLADFKNNVQELSSAATVGEK